MRNELDGLVRRIIVIDDSQDIHDDFRKVLLGSGGPSALNGLEDDIFGERVKRNVPVEVFDIEFAVQGQEGVSKIEKSYTEGQPFMAAFVDMRMPPGWDGLETIERIWQVDPDVQIVICSAVADYSWTEIVQRLGRTDKLLLIKKPFDAMEIAQMASALTQKWVLQQRSTEKIGQLANIVRERTQELERTNRNYRREMVDHRRVQEALRKSEERFRRMCEITPFPVCIHTCDGCMEYVNPQFVKDFGYTIKDVPTNQAWFEDVYPSIENHKPEVHAGEIDQVLSKGRKFEITCKDGNVKIATIRFLPMEDEKTYMVFYEITGAGSGWNHK